MQHPELLAAIRRNCEISDARDNGIYSICTLVLKLRNLYKWEQRLQPWEEPDSGILLDWIEQKEASWEELKNTPFAVLPVNGCELQAWDTGGVNELLREHNLIYGAGYGLSLKAVFFAAELLDSTEVEGLPVLIMGREHAKELSSPFAMLQDGVIYIRREPLRFFIWDQIQEIRTSCKASFHYALGQYGLVRDGELQRQLLRERLDEIVDDEIPTFIRHEVGEHLQDIFTGQTLKIVISNFPATIYEFVSRAVKDVLADIHPKGMLHHIIEKERNASLGFYVGFLSGMRRVLFPEIGQSFSDFLHSGDWTLIERAVEQCRLNNQQRAEQIEQIFSQFDRLSPQRVKERFNTQILRPLDIEPPEE
ncbi:MAG: hypothetical protein OEV64_10415 [Desulfobulbaceae bacterium]|nr:hypothetical protein [Desulfobulbaceae bacterium]